MWLMLKVNTATPHLDNIVHQRRINPPELDKMRFGNHYFKTGSKRNKYK
jgi:hypothetical protein